jgi:hypothetical protein
MMFAALLGRAGLVAAVLTIVSPALPAAAALFSFNDEPFAGTTALETPGRQVIGNELLIPNVNFTTDLFAFDAAAFGIDSLSFFNSLAADLPAAGVNVVVLRDTDNDNDPLTAFNAGSAAGLIAAQISAPTPGFFIYHNSGLGVNRLVFSTDLSETTSDLKVVARFTNPTGNDAIALLPSISEANFQVVPEPSSIALTLASVAGLATLRRKSARRPVRVAASHSKR